jgi:DNA-binding SARP family transcriptional activator/tetratricopeptide (TPR) repeat protein
MSEHTGIRILSSKLTTPHAADTIPRERLLSLVNRAAGKKLTSIVAGAGYGKTTLMAQAAFSWDMQTIWYRLDESDSDLVTFMSYLLAGARKHYPQFGSATIRHLREAHRPNNGFKRITATFLGELDDTVRDKTAIILDDYHSVRESGEIRDAVESLLRDLPPLVHLVLISRSEPALPLARLRAMREVIDVTQEDLSFTAGETDSLCTKMFGLSFDRAKIDAIHRKLGGWISGLILLSHSLKGKLPSEMETDILNLRGSRRAIFSYLEENIYGALSSEKQDFLIKTSIFPRINAPLCDSLLGIDHSLGVLKYLEENHLFTSSDDEGWYCYHQLFRDFLQSRLNEVLEREDILELHRSGAALLEINGEEDEALRHYLAAEEFERACRLLDHPGNRFFAEGRFQLLRSHLGRIPGGLVAERPWIQYLGAQLDGLSGKHREAIEKFEKALPCFLEKGDREGVQSCLVEAGLLQFQTGNLRQAQDRFRELLDQKNLDARLQIEVLGYLIYVSSHLGDMALADRCFEQAMSRLDGLEDEELRHKCLSWVHCYRGFRFAFAGDNARVLETAEYLKTMSHAAGPYRHPLVSYLLEAIGYCGLRLYLKGYEAAVEGLRIHDELSSQHDMTAASDWHSPRLSLRGDRGFPDSLAPWLLACSAQNAIGLGKITEAIENATKSLELFRKIGIRYGEGFAFCVLSKAHMRSGNGVAAEQCARSGMERIKGLGWVRTERMLKLHLIEPLIEKGELEEALRHAKDVEPYFKDGLIGAWINIFCARIYFAGGEAADGLERLLSGLELCRRHGFDTQLASEKHWIVPPLVEAFSQGKMRTYIKEILGGMGPEGLNRLALLRHGDSEPAIREAASDLMRDLRRASPPCLKIHMLGKFRVFVGEKELGADAWKSRKARTLFQFLVYSRPRGYLNKELLMELLWPEEDPAVTVKRLHVALASLRKTLEPEILRGAPSSYVSRMGDSYRIDIGAEGRVDIESFSEQSRLAGSENDPEKSIGRLLNAESLYRGDFMEEEPYSEWCFEARENLRKDYLFAVAQIVAYYERKGDHARCIESAEKYLAVDRYAEPVYRSLMVSYWKIGDKFRMARTFKRCRDSVTKELNCGLSEETEMLYRELARSRQAKVS